MPVTILVRGQVPVSRSTLLGNWSASSSYAIAHPNTGIKSATTRLPRNGCLATNPDFRWTRMARSDLPAGKYAGSGVAVAASPVKARKPSLCVAAFLKQPPKEPLLGMHQAETDASPINHDQLKTYATLALVSAAAVAAAPRIDALAIIHSPRRATLRCTQGKPCVEMAPSTSSCKEKTRGADLNPGMDVRFALPCEPGDQERTS